MGGCAFGGVPKPCWPPKLLNCWWLLKPLPPKLLGGTPLDIPLPLPRPLLKPLPLKPLLPKPLLKPLLTPLLKPLLRPLPKPLLLKPCWGLLLKGLKPLPGALGPPAGLGWKGVVKEVLGAAPSCALPRLPLAVHEGGLADCGLAKGECCDAGCWAP